MTNSPDEDSQTRIVALRKRITVGFPDFGF